MIIDKLEGFGPISNIEDPLELKPLTIFTGDNSSGKTLTSMLFYHLMDTEYLSYLLLEKSDNLISSIKSRLKDSKGKTFSFIFNSNFIDNDNYIYISDSDFSKIDEEIKYYINNKLNLKIDKLFFEKDIKEIKDVIKMEKTTGNIVLSTKNIRYKGPLTSTFLDDAIIRLIIIHIIGISIIPKVSYLPAARTGLLKTFNNTINENLFSNNSKTEDDLNEAEKDFFKKLANRGSYKDDEIASFIETEILRGKLSISSETNDYTFKIGNKKIKKSLYSSTLNELLPLVIFLKKGYLSKDSFLVIEEPEAHLSIKNQDLMAKVLIKLLNRGVKLLITTHSDYLIYVLNNYIKINSLKSKIKDIDKKSFDSNEKKDIKNIEELINNKIFINPKDVAVYNFKFKSKTKSVIKRVNIDKYGIDNKYMNNLVYHSIKENNIILDLMEEIDA